MAPVADQLNWVFPSRIKSFLFWNVRKRGTKRVRCSSNTWAFKLNFFGAIAMKRPTAILAAFAAIAVCTVCSTVYGAWSVSNEGAWPKSWPKELEPLRKQSRSMVGGMANDAYHQIPFTNRKDFEAAWPQLLKVKSKGAPIILERSPSKRLDHISAGVYIHCPPQTGDRVVPETPVAGPTNDKSVWLWTRYIELVVDGKIVDLNRISLPADTPIVDKRFEDRQDKLPARSGDNVNASASRLPVAGPATAPPAAVAPAPSSQQQKTPAKPRPVPRFFPGTHIGAMASSLDGKLIAVGNVPPIMVTAVATGRSKAADNWRPSVTIVDAKTLKPIVSLKLAASEEDAMLAATERVGPVEVTALAFSPDGNIVAVGTSVGQVKLFNPRSGELLRSLDDEKGKLADKGAPEKWKSLKRAMGSVVSLTFSPDGSLLAVCGRSFDDLASVFDGVEQLRGPRTDAGRLKLWEVKNGTIKHELVGHSRATAVAFSPDGKMLASAGNWLTGGKHGTGAILWNPQTGVQIRTMTTKAGGSPHGIAFSPSGKLVAIGWRRSDREDDTSENVGVFVASSGVMDWQKTLVGMAKSVVFMSGAYDSCVMALCHGEFFWLAAQKDKGGTIWSAIHPVDYKDGTRWIDFAMAPQGWRLAVRGESKDKQEFVEVVDFGSPRPATNAAAAKDGQK
jgi:hypothetical protein